MAARKTYPVGELKRFSDRVGEIYGTEDWCMFLYALVKMQKPGTIVELGAGCAATSLWLAHAVKENEAGHVWSVDDGRDWKGVVENSGDCFLPEEKKETFADYFAFVSEKFELNEQVTLLSRTIPPFPDFDGQIELLFSDFAHGASDILAILGHYLPHLSDSASVFIDSASTTFGSYALLELLVAQLNQGKIPAMLLEKSPRPDALKAYVAQKQFTLVHLTEAKLRAQNSTAWIKIQPADLRPYPKTSFH